MDVALLVVLVIVVVGGAIAMKRAGWLDGHDDHDIEVARAAGKAVDETLGPHGG